MDMIKNKIMENIWEAFALICCIWGVCALFVLGGLYIIKQSGLNR